MVSRRGFLHLGAYASAGLLSGGPAAEKKAPESRLIFSAKALLAAIARNEEEIASILQPYFGRLDETPEPKGRELTYEEGMALVPRLRSEVSRVIGANPRPAEVIDLRKAEHLIETVPPLWEALGHWRSVGVSPDFSRASYRRFTGRIELGQKYWQEEEFYGTYPHEITHSHFEKAGIRDKLREAMKKHHSYRQDLQAGIADALLNYEVGNFTNFVNEGAAREVEERCCLALTEETGNSSIMKSVYSEITEELSITYAYALTINKKARPNWFSERYKPLGVESSSMVGPHAPGVAMMKLVRLQSGAGALRQVFMGDISPLERFLA